MKAVEKTGFVQMLKGRNMDVSFAETDTAPKAAEPPARPGAPVRR
jgi:hypothetical protein